MIKLKRLIKTSWILAVLVPIVCVLGSSWLHTWLEPGWNMRLSQEWRFYIIQMVLYAIPFVTYAAYTTYKFRNGKSVSIKGLTAVLIVITFIEICLYGLLLADAVMRDGWGANIGLDSLMLIAPFLLILFIPLGDYLGKKTGNTTSEQ